MHTHGNKVAQILDELGLHLPIPGRPEIFDFSQAGRPGTLIARTDTHQTRLTSRSITPYLGLGGSN